MAENYKIDSKILNQTTQCRDNFFCLSDNKDCLCEVESFLKTNGSTIFIIDGGHSCNYIMGFGKGWICNSGGGIFWRSVRARQQSDV